MKLEYQHSKEEWKKAALAIRGTIQGASRLAMQDLAAQVKREGRGRIAAAGFSRRWQSGFRTYVFPRRITPGSTQDLTMRGQHRLGYANVFERGARISGKPLLWIPLPAAPKKINGRDTTARLYVESVGPLFTINRPGRPPLLAGYAMTKPAPGRKLSVSQLRAGQRNVRRRQVRSAFGAKLGKRPVSVPLFVGIPAVRIAARFNISAVYDRGRQDLIPLYQRRLREVNR